jgi:transposase, IS30 family
MQSYHHFTLAERQNLYCKLNEKKSMRTIAREMMRNVSSISRELIRNRNQDGSYNAWRGCILYIIRRKSSHRTYRIEKDSSLSEWVKKCVSEYWPPETIATTWKLKNIDAKLSHSTIYAALKAGRLENISPKTHLRRHGHRKNTHASATIRPEHLIKDRPDIINTRERIGDWEGDTVYGAIGKGCLVSCVDRKSRFLTAALVDQRTSDLTNEAMQQALQRFPVHSITLDNGSEFAGFKKLEESLKTTIYFADPHSPWQRGTNENFNDLIRFFFPKGTNFHAVSQQTLDYVVGLINNRPRKCLGWLSPAQVFFSACCT